MFWRHLHQFSATISWLSENFCRLARKWGKPSTSLQFAVCLPLHCGRHINSGWQIKHGHDHWQYHCICRLVYGLHYCLRLPEHRTRAYTQKKKKKNRQQILRHSGAHKHKRPHLHKERWKMAQKLLSQTLFPAFVPAIPAISWTRRDSFRTELASKLAIVFDYVRTPLAGVKINLILSLHKYRLARGQRGL